MRLLLCSTILCILPAFAIAIRCYQCTHLSSSAHKDGDKPGTYNENCNKNASSIYLKECTRETPSLAFLNITQDQHPELRESYSCYVVGGKTGSNYYVIRGCSSPNSGGCDRFNENGGGGTVCYCNTDGCNEMEAGSLNTISPSFCSLLLIIMISVIL